MTRKGAAVSSAQCRAAAAAARIARAPRTISLARPARGIDRRRWVDVSGRLRRRAAHGIRRSPLVPGRRRDDPERLAQPAGAPARREGRPNRDPAWTTTTASASATRTRLLARNGRGCAYVGREGPDHGPRTARHLVEEILVLRSESRADAPSARRPTCGRPALQRASVGGAVDPTAPPETTTAPAARELAGEVLGVLEGASPTRSREPTMATTRAASVEPPCTVTEAGASLEPRRRDGIPRVERRQMNEVRHLRPSAPGSPGCSRLARSALRRDARDGLRAGARRATRLAGARYLVFE